MDYLLLLISMFFASIMTFRLIEHIKIPVNEIAYKQEHKIIEEFDRSVGDGEWLLQHFLLFFVVYLGLSTLITAYIFEGKDLLIDLASNLFS